MVTPHKHFLVRREDKEKQRAEDNDVFIRQRRLFFRNPAATHLCLHTKQCLCGVTRTIFRREIPLCN